MKLQTQVETEKSRIGGISYENRIMVLGSCFADNIGMKMEEAGYNVYVNPFGTLYNPVSIRNSVMRMISAEPFSDRECVQMGSGSPLFCSFSHHTSFAGKTPEEFLSKANESLSEASGFFSMADRVIITLGTSRCYRHNESGKIVSNCLKRDAREFAREMLSVEETAEILEEIVCHPSVRAKKFILTVSPVRHLKDGAHGNQLSKAALLLAADAVCGKYPARCEYFPSYEIVMDELRDYRFYAEDMIHTTGQTVNYIWERFCDFAVPESEKQTLAKKMKEYRQSRHIDGYRMKRI